MDRSDLLQRQERLQSDNQGRIKELLRGIELPRSFQQRVFELRRRHSRHLSDSKASGNGSSSPLFWVVAEAVSGFQAEHRELPLSGALLDMTSVIPTSNCRRYQAKAIQ